MDCSVTSQKTAYPFSKPSLDFVNTKSFATILSLFTFICLVMPTLVGAEMNVRLDDGQVYSVRGYHDNDETLGSTGYRENAIELIDDIVVGNLQGKSAETIATLAGVAETLATVQSIDLEAYNASLENIKKSSDLGTTVNAAAETASAVSQAIMSYYLTKKPTLKGKVASVIGLGLDAVTVIKGVTSSTKGIVLGVALMDFAQKELVRAYEIKSKLDAGGWVGLDELNELSVSIENARVIGVIGADIAEQASSTDESLKERAYRHLGGLANAAASAIIGQLPSNKYTNAALAATVIWNAAIDAESYADSQDLDEKVKKTDMEVKSYLAEVGKSPVSDPASIAEYVTLAEGKGFKTQDVIDFEVAEEKRIRDAKISRDKKEAEKIAEQARLAKEEAELKKKQLEEEMARLEKDLNAEAAELDSLTDQLKNAADINQLKAALDEADDDYDDNRSRRRMLTRQINDYNEALKQLTGKIKVYEVTIRGVVYKPEDVPTLQSRIREQEAILNTLVHEFQKPGGLEETYDAAKERYDQLVALETQKQEQQAALEKAQQELAALEESIKEEESKIEQTQRDLQEATAIAKSNKYDSPSEMLQPLPAPSSPKYTSPGFVRQDGYIVGISEQSKEDIIDNGFADSTPGSGSITPPGNLPTLMAGIFRGTEMAFESEPFDIHEIVNARFGDNYRVADWNEVKAAYNDDMGRFKQDFGYDPNIQLTDVENRFFQVTRNGNRYSSSGGSFRRQYVSCYYGGATPSYFASHDNINNHDIDLGSWHQNDPVLAVKIDPTIDDTPLETSAPDIGTTTWSGSGLTIEMTGPFDASADILTTDLQYGFDSANNSLTTVVEDNVNINIRASYVISKNDFMVTSFDTIPTSSNYNGGGGKWAITDPDGENRNYDYLTWGVWQENLDPNKKTVPAHWLVGMKTSGSNIQTGGSATYTGSTEGIAFDAIGLGRKIEGGVALTANFDNRTLAGQFSNVHMVDGGSWEDASMSKTLNVNASWQAGINTIAGTVSHNGDIGSVQGHFFGPNAEEIGGSWTHSGGGNTAAGVFRAQQ